MFRESSGGPSRPSSTPSLARFEELPWRANNSRVYFRDLVVFAFPGPKPEVELMRISGKSESTCRRWLSDEGEPPASVFALVLAEFLWRFGGGRKR